MKPILDPCCGSRMFWFDRQNQLALFGDMREETHTLCDGRVLEIKPDVQIDFRKLPFPDGSFHLVVFDPPHLVHAGRQSWLALKYGRLSKDWRQDIRQGFEECFRVLKPFGTLVFKWDEDQVKLADVLKLAPCPPLFGNRRPKNTGAHWLVFMKDAGDGNLHGGQNKNRPVAEAGHAPGRVEHPCGERWERRETSAFGNVHDGQTSERAEGEHGAGVTGAYRPVAERQPASCPVDGFWRDSDWLFCKDGKWRPVEPGLEPLAHRSAARVGRLRAYGNAIVPQVAATFIRACM